MRKRWSVDDRRKALLPPAIGDVRRRVALSATELRIARRWTRAELARRAGISPATVTRAEAGNQIRINTLSRLAAAFKVPVERLLVPRSVQ
jgi:DNA-binding Xre family transcriptional regulator